MFPMRSCKLYIWFYHQSAINQLIRLQELQEILLQKMYRTVQLENIRGAHLDTLPSGEFYTVLEFLFVQPLALHLHTLVLAGISRNLLKEKRWARNSGRWATK